jgi:hexulose-6-phosphate isomerase
MPELSALPLGIYEKALPDAEWPELLRTAKDLGFDFVEMSIDESPRRLARVEWSAAERREFVQAVWESGLRVPSICLSGNRATPIGSEDPELVARGIELMQKAVDLSADIGVRIVQVAGYDVYYNEVSTPETRQRFAENLAKVVDYAAEKAVMLSVEIMDTRYMSSLSRFLHLHERIRSPWLTVYPDLGNLSAWNDNAAEELELGLRMGLVAAVHLKDTYPVTADFPGQFRDVPFGEGCVDFPRLFSVLKRGGYAGQFLIEMWNRGEYDLTPVIGARDWLRELMTAADRVE